MPPWLRRRLPLLLAVLLVTGTAAVALVARTNGDDRRTDVATLDDPTDLDATTTTETTLELPEVTTTLETTPTTLPAAPPSQPERPSPPIRSTTTAKPAPPFGAVTNIEGPGIYVANADGTNLRRLSKEQSGYPVWSPDGSRVAYITGAGPNLVVQTVDSGAKRTVATNAVIPRDGPSWNPAGTYLAYPGSGGTNASGNPERDPYVVAADGNTPPRQITIDGDDATVAFGPSPNGLLATMSDRGLFVMQPDGSERRQLSDKPFNYGLLRWSPDGARIATIPTSTANHFVITVDAPNTETTIGGADTNMRIDAGAWSPDGTRLVIEGYRRDQNTFGTWFAPANGDPPTLLAANHGDPDWSAATNTIVTIDQNKWGVALTAADTNNTVTRFERGGTFRAIANPHLSPDGRQLVFAINA